MSEDAAAPEPQRGHAVHTEDLYRLLVERVRDYAIFAMDPHGYILSWNPGAQRFKGYTADEIIGRHFSIFYPEDAIRIGHPENELRIATRDGVYEEEGWRLRKDGTRFWASVTITALRDDGGTLVGFAKVTRDLTEQKAAQERAIEDARRVAEAEAANRAKAEFLTSLSHELRTPLNAIGGYSDLLLLGVRGPLTPEIRSDLERIQRSQQHLMTLINDLLNFSRIEAGTVTYTLAVFAIAPVLEHVTDMLEPQANARGIRMERRPCPPEAQATADSARVEQILINLMTNAVKFTPPGGSIRIGCALDERSAHITVTDTGVGISPAMLASIFDPFVQAGRTLTSAHEGVGLGLSISRELARGMGGELTVSSVPDRGSSFTLTLPRA